MNENIYKDLPEETLSQKIYKCRKIMGYSLTAIAKHLDVSIALVKRWEMEDCTPSKKSLEKLRILFSDDKL